MSEQELIKAQAETIKTQRELIDYLKAELEARKPKVVFQSHSQPFYQVPDQTFTPFTAPLVVPCPSPMGPPFTVTCGPEGTVLNPATSGFVATSEK